MEYYAVYLFYKNKKEMKISVKICPNVRICIIVNQIETDYGSFILN